MMFRVTFGSTYQFIDLFILGLTSLLVGILNLALSVVSSPWGPSTSGTLLQHTSLQE